MWNLTSDYPGDTFTTKVKGGWLVMHYLSTNANSKTLTFVNDPLHEVEPGTVNENIKVPIAKDDVPVSDPVLTPVPELNSEPIKVSVGPNGLPLLSEGLHYEEVFTDNWAPNWTEYSWATTNDNFTDNNQTVIRSDINGWTAFNAARTNNKTFSTINTLGVAFQIKGEGDGSQASSLSFSFTSGRNTLGSKKLSDLFPNGLPTESYANAFVSFEDVGLDFAICTNFLIKGISAAAREAITIDNIYLVKYDVDRLLPEVKLDTNPIAPTPFTLTTQGNKILESDIIFQGKGVNLHDTRGNNACAYNPPKADEVIRRLDHLKLKGVTLVRLLLESYNAPGGRTQWKSVLDDGPYLEDIKAIIAHAGSLGIKVILTPWIDASYSTITGEPTARLAQVWQKLTSSFIDSGHVIFGILNEPTNNYNGLRNEDRRQGFLEVIKAIREVEKPSQRHLIAVQGIGGWARHMKYWVENPINDTHVVYEVHAYDPKIDFETRFINPSQTLPIIIGEFGPDGTYMSLDDCAALIMKANELKISWLGWAFHPESHPSMLVNQGSNCGLGMDLEQLTEWGTLIFNNI